MIEELTDILNEETFNYYWQNIAQTNTNCYDTIDSTASVYKCETLNDYISGLEAYKNPLRNDPIMQPLIDKIQGFLVFWPLNFLLNEDLSPSVGTRAILSNEVWV